MPAAPPHDLDAILRATLDDHRLSRSERSALRDVLADCGMDAQARAFVRHRVFALARDCIRDPGAREVLAWAEDVIKVVDVEDRRAGPIAEVHFSPGDACRRRIGGLLDRARDTADICVFTITDDALAEHILAARQRGVRIRVATDDDKALDRGSDVHRLAAAGVHVRTDDSEHHMHHKFAVFDRTIAITGSYNWTRSAAEHNRENLVVTDDPRIVDAYACSFDALWNTLVDLRQ